MRALSLIALFLVRISFKLVMLTTRIKLFERRIQRLFPINYFYDSWVEQLDKVGHDLMGH